MLDRTRLAKLSRPSVQAAYARSRLFDRLARANAAPAFWICGPPGSGKTTLVADYTARRDLPCLWYQVDRGDEDVASFFFYFSAAAREHLGPHALPVFQPECLADTETFARSYFRELFHQSEVAVVLDNYQEIARDARLHGVIREALSEAPEFGRLFVISRGDPPSAFASFRARGRLDVLGWSDLRLQRDECTGIARARGLDLDDDQAEQLHVRTQGWAAGVILLLQDLRSKEPVSPLRRPDTPAVIFDYVAEEIFKKLDPQLQEFLLHAAYLPQITTAMATKLGLAEAAPATLRELAASEFLLSVVQSEPQVIFQFHPLLREFLLTRAEETGSGAAVTARKQRAAAVLAEHDHIEAAADLLIQIADWDALVAQIHAQAERLLAQSRAQTLERWIRALPEARVAVDPWLSFWLGGSVFPYRPREALQLFSTAYQQFLPGVPVDLRGLLEAINGAMEAILHDADDWSQQDGWIEAATRWARDLASWPNAELEARLTCNMFMALVLRQPQHPDLAHWRERTQQLGQLQRDPNLKIAIDCMLATLSAWNGQFAGAERLLDALRELLRLPEVSPVSATKFSLAESILLLLSGERIRCLEAAHRGLEIIAHSGVRLWNDTFLINALCGALADADLDAAGDYLRQIEQRPLASRSFDVFLRSYGAAWYAMLQGDAFLAHQHIKAAVLAADRLGTPLFRIVAGLALVQVLFDSGDDRGAQRELDHTLTIAPRLGNRLLDFMIGMCRARLGLARGDDGAALEQLRAALTIARERNLQHFLWWNPTQVARLFQRALETGIEPDFARRVIRRRGLMPQPPPYHLRQWPWRYEVHVFGSFRLESAVVPIERGARRPGKPLELLQAMISLGAQNVRTERLQDALWPRIDTDYAHRSLNTTLHRLRRLLGAEEAILTSGGELSLNRQLFWIDAWAFEQACTEAAAPLSQGDPGADLLALRDCTEAALVLYRGAFLADDHELPWAAAARERYRGMLLRLIGASSQAFDKHGCADEAIDLHRRAVESDPLFEPLTVRLITALHRTGRTGDAIDCYNRFRQALHDVPGREPSAAAEGLFRSLTGG